MGQKQGQIWMPGGVPVIAMSRREHGEPRLENVLDEDDTSDDENPVLVDKLPALANDTNPFGTEEEDILITDDLGFNEEEG